MTPLFHLTRQVIDLDEARWFYGEVLGCIEGDSTENKTEFDFFGQQLTLHLDKPTTDTKSVSSEKPALPHFGINLDMDTWYELIERLEALNIQFEKEPTIHLADEDEPGEQGSFFIRDPSGNLIEINGVHCTDMTYVL